MATFHEAATREPIWLGLLGLLLPLPHALSSGVPRPVKFSWQADKMAAETTETDQLIAKGDDFSDQLLLEQQQPGKIFVFGFPWELLLVNNFFLPLFPEDAPIPDENPDGSPPGCHIKCANCDTIFTPDQFEEHVCEYDEQGNRIEPPGSESVGVDSPSREGSNATAPSGSGSLLEGHACFQQLEENIQQWRKLTKRKGE